jgi:hypothetical protein
MNRSARRHPGIDDLPSRRITGWRLALARVMAFWYLAVLAAAIVAFFAIWAWLFRTSPDDMYWSCMKPWIQPYKQGGMDARTAFVITDSDCSRPPDLSRDDALREWLRLWGSQ